MESATTFVQPGTLPRPRLIGLSVRLVLGLVCCSSALFYGTHPDYLFRPGLPPLLLFVGPAFAVWVLPPVVNLGFGRSWRNRPRLVVLVLGLGATVIDLLVYEQLWAPPLAALVYGTTVYTLAHLGLSFVLATLLGTPGCEMRAIPDLLGRLIGRAAAEHHCPGFITPLDNWEARRGQSVE